MRTVAYVVPAMLLLVGLAPPLSANAASQPAGPAPVKSAASATSLASTAHQSRPAATAHASPIVCSASVALGSTSMCEFASAGTARYRFSVPAADTIRFRAAIPSTFVDRHLTLSRSDGSVICTKQGYAQFDCAVTAGGTYRLDVAVDAAVTVYTTIASVRTASCGPGPDLAVGQPGLTVTTTSPGASSCTSISAAAGDVLGQVLDVNTDQGLRLVIYDDNGVARCTTLVTAFARSECTLTGGSGLRMFVTFDDDAAQSATLILARLSHPTGCQNGVPDAFGTLPSRFAALPPHQERCYRFDSAGGGHLGVHLLATSGPSGSLSWRIRDDSGAVACSGSQGAVLTNCSLASAGTYTLFVSQLARDTVSYRASLTDLAADSGCIAVPSTAWGATPSTGTLSNAGQVDCRTFSASAGHRVRLTIFDRRPSVITGLLVNGGGETICSFVNRQDCVLSGTGPFRVLESSASLTAVGYRLWATDTDRAAGCTSTASDVHGTGAARSGELTADTISVCWRFTGSGGAAYVARAAGTSGGVFPRWEIRSLGPSIQCDGATDPPGACRLGAAGTYLLVVSPYVANGDPSQVGTFSAGLWRIDGAGPCPAMSTAFDDPATQSAIDTPLELDCNTIRVPGGDVLSVASENTTPSVGHEIVDSTGALRCTVVSGTCRADGPGPYRVLSYATGPYTGAYRFRIASITRQAGCRTLDALPFGRAPGRSLELTDSLDLRCYRIERTVAQGQLAVRVVGVDHPEANPDVLVYNANQVPICSLSTDFGACATTGAGTYLLVASANAAVQARIGWYDLTASDGCRPGPTLAFNTPATAGQLNNRGVVACVNVPLAALDYGRFIFGPSAANVNFHGRLIDASGVDRCTFHAASLTPANCRVPGVARGPFRILIWASEDGAAFTGGYQLHAWRLNESSGCADMGSFAGGFGPLVGELPDPTDEVCFGFRAVSSQLSATTSNDDVPSLLPAVQFIHTRGTVDCAVQGGPQTCFLGNGSYAVVVMLGAGQSTFTGHYRVTGDCLSAKCGP